ncbi:hypothetical protein I7I50_11767 [Histoplasma capsulatum G186AR]|uniref:Uncharacterized protein n=1 Tax=Ajellomyces capsulatus TaxID=5037 RepID=A0A8H7Z8B5_AJECA|nr:hypothetical protein I7I52_03005 [Histoplasma capsulatum]QSS70209.1 hypothetical protein I7I50_11767 [Histoplasma capsulatum G186AR]
MTFSHSSHNSWRSLVNGLSGKASSLMLFSGHRFLCLLSTFVSFHPKWAVKNLVHSGAYSACLSVNILSQLAFRGRHQVSQ